MKSTLSKVFCLEGLLLDQVLPSLQTIDLLVRSPRTHAICSRCGYTTTRIHRQKYRRIKHLISDSKLVILKVKLRSFFCHHCQYHFQESIPGIDRRQTTAHFRKSLIPKIKDRSFSSVAVEYGISPSAIIRSSKDLSREIGILWPQTTFTMGIDEHSFSGTDFVATITDLTHHRLLAILIDDSQATIREFLRKIPQSTRNLITEICIDMKSAYRSVIESELSGKSIVIDKFHVIQLCNQQLQQLRLIFTACSFPLPKKLLEKNREDLTVTEHAMLKQMFRAHPSLEEMWRLKEFVRTMYRIKSPQKAAERYQSLLDGLLGDSRPRWQALYRTFKRWRKYILNYFENYTTNAYTEGVHTRIKLLKRISYGFRNKLNYIAKMTLAFIPLATMIFFINSSPSLT